MITTQNNLTSFQDNFHSQHINALTYNPQVQQFPYFQMPPSTNQLLGTPQTISSAAFMLPPKFQKPPQSIPNNMQYSFSQTSLSQQQKNVVSPVSHNRSGHSHQS